MEKAIAEAEDDPRDFKVGAVIVTRDGYIIRAHGGEDELKKEHAEHRAIEKCFKLGHSLEGATLYTTLEPCVEHSRSPGDIPCAVKILDTSISKVVIGLIDVDGRVRKRGISKLRGKRLEVVECNDLALRQRIERLMASFLTRDRPHLLECPPYGSPVAFFGRQEERVALTDWLCKRGADGLLPIFVLYDGPGGTGKSSLAYVWMKRDVVGDDLPLPKDSPDEAKRSRVGDGWRTGLTVLWFSFYVEDGGGDFYSFLERAIEHLSHKTKRSEDYRDGQRLNYARLAEDVIEYATTEPTLLIWEGAERLLREYDLSSKGARHQETSRQRRESEARLCADVNVARFLAQLSGSVYPSSEWSDQCVCPA